ncbi:MAG: heparinase II/III family protein [Luteolibacter sp.]
MKRSNTHCLPNPLRRLVMISIAAVSAASGIPCLPVDVDWAKLPPHPRLFGDTARLEVIKTQSDEVSQELLALLKSEAEKAQTLKPIVYPASGIMFNEMRDVQGRILALSLQYRLTGEKHFFTEARQELLHLADLPDWGTSHFLDVGEASLAAGVGLDWLHDDLSPEDRDRIVRAIVERALRPSLEVPEGGGSWVNGDFNWAQVCHGGLVVGALAIAEREPVLARQIVERAVKNLDKVGATYAPDGSYAEGPSYWLYGTSIHVILIEALRTALGTSCDLEKFPGFLKTAGYKIQMMAPSGEDYNYSDYHNEHLNEPIMLWFARELRDSNIARGELAAISRRLVKAVEDKHLAISRHLPLELFWWDPTLPSGQDLRARHWTASGVLPLAVMRSAWDDPNASFIALKGGTPNHSHAHMDVGGFILEADGVRWAVDLGTEDYDKMRSAGLDLWNYTQESSRWTCFRVGPEGHNILRFDGTRQNISGKAEIRALPDDQGTMANIVDLTSIYQKQVTHVERTVKLKPDRSISIEDQWTAAGHPVSASFQWLTMAKVIRNQQGLLLEQAGKCLTLEVAPTDAKIEIEDVSAARALQDSPNSGLSRIVITIPTTEHSTATLRVLAIPDSTRSGR